MNKLRMGIIGMGMAFERLHYPAYQKLTDKYQIAAVCDLDKNQVPVTCWDHLKGGVNFDFLL